MKILMVNKFLYPNGGSETYMLKLGEYLTYLGHEVEYFGMEHEDRCVGNSANSYTENMDFHNSGKLKQIKLSLKTIYSVEARKKIGIVLDKFKPDVVHLNNINFQLTPSIIYEIKKRNIPIVQTVHDVQIACPNHRMYIDHKETICNECFNKKYTNCIKNKCVHNSFVKSTLATIESYLYHKKDTYNLVDAYICPSQFMADTITRGGVESGKITVLHNYSEKQSDNILANPKENYVLFFGRISIEKGIKTLIECCKELKDIQFVIAGTGPLAHICEGIENVKAVGFKGGDELKELIRKAKLSVNPSEWYENCPMSVIESLSLGTPAIVSNLGGAKELIVENETGLSFEAKNKEELKQAVSSLFYNDDLLNKMSKKCVEYSTKNTIDKYSETVIDVYKKLLGKERNNHG